MVNDILKIILGTLIPMIIGFLISKVSNVKTIKIAMMTLIQSNLTNTYFVYEQLKEIPDYVYRNWLNLLKIYEKLGGDDYIHELADRMKTWEIAHTGIIKG